jgi:hypothetical protein
MRSMNPPPIMDVETAAKLLGGDAIGRTKIVAPGPGHSARDRSLSILLTPGAPDGFAVTSFANDDWRNCRDHVRRVLGLRSGVSNPRRLRPTLKARNDDRVRIATRLWEEGTPIRATVAEAYLANRGLDLHSESYEANTLRCHNACPFRLADGRMVRLPALIAKMVDIHSGEFRGVHRTALAPNGHGKANISGLGNPKKMLGSATGACVKLSPDEEVTSGLHIAEGIETALACIAMGFRPTWSALSAGGVANFPVLAGVEALTIFADNDEAGLKAAQTCSDRWVSAGNEVRTVIPQTRNSDFAEKYRP